MKFKRFMTLPLSVILLFVFVFPAYAAPTEENQPSSSYTFSEYDLFESIQELSIDELSESGYSESEIVVLKNSSFEELLLERATLSHTQLQNLGYTEDEIVALKQLSEGVISYSEIDVYALAGTCTGVIELITASPSYFYFQYKWEWDHAPVMMFTDSMALRWYAVNSTGSQVDVNLTSQHGVVHYYMGSTLTNIEYLDPAASLDFRTLKYDFSVGLNNTHWAKMGWIVVELSKDPTVTSNINYINAAGLYGHTLFNVGSPSISFSGGEIGFSFTGTLNPDNIASAKLRMYSNGTVAPIPE